MRMLVKCKLPISLVNKDGFKRLIKYLAPYYTVRDRKTFNTLIRRTLHYLTPELDVHNANIGVLPMDKSHTSKNIIESLNDAFEEFHINKVKVLSVTTESASNIKGYIQQAVEKAKWIPCYAHVLSHLVPDVLKPKKNKKKDNLDDNETDDDDDNDDDIDESNEKK